jgi:hypothetical protein
VAAFGCSADAAVTNACRAVGTSSCAECLVDSAEEGSAHGRGSVGLLGSHVATTWRARLLGHLLRPRSRQIFFISVTLCWQSKRLYNLGFGTQLAHVWCLTLRTIRVSLSAYHTPSFAAALSNVKCRTPAISCQATRDLLFGFRAI